MPTLKRAAFLLFSILVPLASCSPISGPVQKQALQVPFERLMEDTARYQGELVLLGGYIIETTNLANQTRILVLQAPLDFSDNPKSKDKSQGRMIVIHEGYLDPEVYEKERAITVAGTLLGKETGKPDLCPFSCLTIKSRELYLWPEERYYPPYWGPYSDPFYYYDYPWYFHRRPFFHPYYPYGPRYYPYRYW